MSRYEAKINITDTIYKKFSTPLFTGDVGNNVHLEFFLRGKPYTGSNANVYKLMPDGKSASVTVTMKDNVCEFTIPNIMYSNASESEIELQIALLDDIGNILTSGVLYFEVQEGLSEKTQIIGTDEYNDMTALLKQTAEAASAANEAAVRAEQAIADINTTNVYKYKGSYKDFETFVQHFDKNNAEVGYVWNIAEGGIITGGISITGRDIILKPGDNIALAANSYSAPPKFDVLAGTVDLSSYSTTEQVSEMINSYVEEAILGGEW